MVAIGSGYSAAMFGGSATILLLFRLLTEVAILVFRRGRCRTRTI